MVDTKAYIESGILELYLAGVLTETENEEVHAIVKEHKEVRNELEKLESTIVELTAQLSPSSFKNKIEKIVQQIGTSGNSKRTTSVSRYQYIGWAAAFIIVLGGLIFTLMENKQLKSRIASLNNDNIELQEKIVSARLTIEDKEALLGILRDKEIQLVPLQGQADFAESYAKVFWNKKEDKVYLDALGLPEPPEGKVYQVWSLTLNPLTPTSIGLLNDFALNEDKVFNLSNDNTSEAFGITLEPAGGSDSPTMDQLYTLGVVSS